MRKRNEGGTRAICATLLLCAALSFAGCETAADVAVMERAALSPLPEASDTAKRKTAPVYIDSMLYARAYVMDGKLFVQPKALCAYLGCDMSWKQSGKKLTLTLPGVLLTADSSLPYMTANGRYLYEPEGWLTEDGELYLPVDALERLFGVTAKARKDGGLDISTEGYSMLTGGDDYYELNFPGTDLFWLTQIISAEAKYQPLAGMIGVGNVVLNRVASDKFPNTVFEVIYDTQGVVQFEPVSNGSIKAEIEEGSDAYIAACLCLEGYNTVDDCLFFYNPDCGNQWFDSTRELVLIIGDHNFYR